jgi:hypothetical protein
MSVDVDRKIRVLLADRSNQESGSFRLEDSRHILDAQDMDLEINKLCDQIHIIFKVILLLWVLMIELVNAVVLFNQIDEAKRDDEERVEESPGKSS